jgi:hypothetical protein
MEVAGYISKIYNAMFRFFANNPLFRNRGAMLIPFIPPPRAPANDLGHENTDRAREHPSSHHHARLPGADPRCLNSSGWLNERTLTGRESSSVG